MKIKILLPLLALALLISQAVKAVPVTYEIAGSSTIEIEGPIQNLVDGLPFPVAADSIYSPGETLNVSLSYDPAAPGIFLPAFNATVYLGATSNLSASIGTDNFTDPGGNVFVNDDAANDLVMLFVDPALSLNMPGRNINGFSIQDSGGQLWILSNLRIFWINGDFLSDELLPSSLPVLGAGAARMALDFWDMAPIFDQNGDVTNNAQVHTVFFDITDVARTNAVDEPSVFALLLLGLLGLRFSRRKTA